VNRLIETHVLLRKSASNFTSLSGMFFESSEGHSIANIRENLPAMKITTIACMLLSISSFSFAIPPGTTSKHIKIDQFGYLPNSRKIAVIVDPQVGYNAAESFSPGTGANQ